MHPELLSNEVCNKYMFNGIVLKLSLVGASFEFLLWLELMADGAARIPSAVGVLISHVISYVGDILCSLNCADALLLLLCRGLPC